MVEGRRYSLGHVFCKACIEQWLVKNATCPIGREPLKPQGLVVARTLYNELVGELLVACPNTELLAGTKKGKGCTWKKSFAELEGHLKECKFVVEQCGKCKANIAVSLIDTHKLACPERDVACQYCQQSLLAKNLAHHQSSSCALSPVCVIMCVCGERIQRRNQESHLSQQLAKHLLLNTQKLAKLEAAVGVLSTTVGMLKSATFSLEVDADVSMGPGILRSETILLRGVSVQLVCSTAVNAMGEIVHSEGDMCTAWLQVLSTESVYRSTTRCGSRHSWCPIVAGCSIPWNACL